MLLSSVTVLSIVVDGLISYYGPVIVYSWSFLTRIEAHFYNMALVIPLTVHM